MRWHTPALLGSFLMVLVISSAAGAASYSIEEKDLFHYTVQFPDAPASCTQVTSGNLPTGSHLDPATGLFTWVPDFGSAGSYPVSFSCADNPGGTPNQITVDVAAAAAVPVVATTPKVSLVAGAAAGTDQDNDRQSLATMLGVYGLNVERVDDLAASFAAGTVGDILVLPSSAARALSADAVQQVVSYVEEGGSILLFGKSSLSEALGISYSGGSGTVTQFVDYLNPQLFQIWADGEPVDFFDTAAGDTVFSYDQATGRPIAIGRRNGAGAILYVGTDYYDHFSTYGTKGHPYLLYHFADHFRLKPAVSAGSIDAYFDPGNYDLSKVYVEDLVRGWAGRGITTVYAAGWHFWINEQTAQEWTFGYQHLIDVCHLWGIKVYAWFAIPHVSQKFWFTRPECREQTAGAGENYAFWRLMVNLQNPVCLGSVQQFVDDVLTGYDWDGVNLAEIYYDNEAASLQYFTPMNVDFRQNYAAISGLDPIVFFDPASPHYYLNDPTAWGQFLQYRENVVTGLHHTFLDGIFHNPKAADLDVILTAVDSQNYSYPDVTQKSFTDTGVDLPAILGFMNTFDFAVQVEDPWQFWSSNPYRYGDFKNTYQNEFPHLKADPSALMFDVNIVTQSHVGSNGLPAFHFPANIQTGQEFSLLLKNMFSDSNRLALFSENTVQAEDFARLKWALAADTTVTRPDAATVSYSAKRTVKLEGEHFDRVSLDGREWPGWSSVDNGILLPTGDHTVRLVRGEYYNGIRLVSASCLLHDAAVVPGGISADYESPRQKGVLTVEAFAKLDSEPFRVLVDGQTYDAPIYPFYGQYRLFLPKGRHTVQVYVMHDLTPSAGQQGPIPINRPITVTFTVPIDPATLTTATLIVTDAAGHVLSGTVSYDAATMTASFTPDQPLAAGSGYTVTVTAQVKDIFGRSVAGGRALPIATDSYGDINNNGKVDLAAALKFFRVAVGLEPQPAVDPGRIILAPVNRATGKPQPAPGRTKINLQDVVAVLERIVGLW
ncbi:Ig-like domain-containing protein [Geomesophilobacter sediminis]|uniref:Ig-like domain-containing protein n=1 Tax=Geomesophilobacter sediminis TaxID=2798584 RepID=A0A8J7SCU5_9BACT|nr:Ig-like domain-containing protein [Geomesophilobacter sediminis]MBJ6727409.1 Ig-like domain-containing protein [Geomesophilobacter sediminis]